MLNPSYSSLIRVLNEEAKADTRITSRYSVVIAAAKRARQIVGGANHEAFNGSDKAVSIAVNEIQNGNIRIVPGSNGYWDFDVADHNPHNIPTLIDEGYTSNDSDINAEENDAEDIDEDFEEDDTWDDEDEEEDD